MPALILVVHAETAFRRRLDESLSDAGYLVATAPSFEQGLDFLNCISPDLLVADIRLGAFNGLHLAARARFVNPSLPIIITHAIDDVVLRHEAARLGATFVVDPADDPGFILFVRECLEQYRRTQPMIRRWPRKSLSETLEARVDSASARVIEVSYGGLRLAFEGEPDSKRPAFEISLPTAGITLTGYRVWAGPSHGDSYLCGVELPDNETSRPWRAFVDGVT